MSFGKAFGGWAVLAAAVLGLAGCGGGGGGGGSSGPPAIGTKGWTVLVYMTADNNLEAAGLQDLQEMASISSGPDMRFVVQVDRAAGQYAGGLLNVPDFTSTKRLVVRPGQLDVLSDLGEVDMGQAASLAAFVNWGVKAYPGERYALVLWDHGGGWKGFGWDDSHPTGTGEPDHLSLDRIVTGVSQGLVGTAVTKFDLIGFDACLMATLEVAESLQPYASYLLASEEVEPGHGWDWAAFAGGGLLDPVALGKKVVDGFYAQAEVAQDAADVTLSIIDLSKLGPIETALATLATSVDTAPEVATALPSVVAGRKNAVEYAANPDPAQAYALVDMVDLFGPMSSVAGAAAAQAAVTAAVVYEKHGAAKAGSHGLSVYFPPDSSLYNAAYDALPGAGVASWRAFLTALYGGGAAQAVPAFASGSYTAAAAGLTLTGVVTAGTEVAIARATIGYGIPDGGGGAYLLGDQPAGLAGTTVTGEWDWSALQVVQGTYREYGYLTLEVISTTPPGLVAASIPLAYDPPGAGALQMALWRIVFDGSGTLASNNVFLYAGGGVAELSAAPGSRLRALVAHMPSLGAWSSTWVLSDDTGAGFDATQPLALDMPALPSGWAAAALLRIENAGGQGDWIYLPPPSLTVP